MNLWLVSVQTPGLRKLNAVVAAVTPKRARELVKELGVESSGDALAATTKQLGYSTSGFEQVVLHQHE